MTAARAVALLIAGAVATSPANAIPERREKSMNMNLLDESIVCFTIHGEAGGVPFAAKEAVAWVIRNRMEDPRWPDKAGKVCIQPKQFSVWDLGRPRITMWFAYHNDLEQAAWIESMAAWEVAMAKPRSVDPTNGANHYSYSIKFPENLAAAWTGGDTDKLIDSYVTSIGGIHLFRIEE